MLNHGPVIRPSAQQKLKLDGFPEEDTSHAADVATRDRDSRPSLAHRRSTNATPSATSAIVSLGFELAGHRRLLEKFPRGLKILLKFVRGGLDRCVVLRGLLAAPGQTSLFYKVI